MQRVDHQPPTERLATIAQPTLVATGEVRPDAQIGMRGLPTDFFEQAADAIVASIPNAEPHSDQLVPTQPRRTVLCRDHR